MRKRWLFACFVFSLFRVLVIDCRIASAGHDQSAPPAKNSPAAIFTQEQCRRLRERDKAKTQLAQLRGAGKFAEAAALAEKMLLVDRDIFGPDHSRQAQITVLREPAAVLSRRKELAKEITGIRSAGRGFDQGNAADANQSPPVFWAAFVLSGDPR
jgi:hypothetical protein